MSVVPPAIRRPGQRTSVTGADEVAASPHSGSIDVFLRAVTRAGFEGASSPVGIDGDGRERLVFIGGEIPVRC